MKDVVRLHASSGTTGKPIVVAYTQEDIDVWTSVLGRCSGRLRTASRRHYSGRLRLRPLHRRPGRALRRGRAGATVVPASGGHADRQIMLMKDFGVTAMCCTPTYFLHLIDRAADWAWT
jgi:phenylacetate-CoA ligase